MTQIPLHISLSNIQIEYKKLGKKMLCNYSHFCNAINNVRIQLQGMELSLTFKVWDSSVGFVSLGVSNYNS